MECVSCLLRASEDEVEVDKKMATPTAKQRHEENRKTRDKMKLVRSQMERCSSLKEKKYKVSVLAYISHFMLQYWSYKKQEKPC